MASLNNDQVVKKIRDGQGGKSLREYATSLGITAGYLSDIYCGKREPGPKILKRFNLTKLRTTTIAYVSEKRAK